MFKSRFCKFRFYPRWNLNQVNLRTRAQLLTLILVYILAVVLQEVKFSKFTPFRYLTCPFLKGEAALLGSDGSPLGIGSDIGGNFNPLHRSPYLSHFR